MSDQSKFYDYYMVEGDEVKSLIAGYDDIGEQRNSILPEAAGKVGAIAWTTSSGWGGGGGLLNGFVWDKGYQFPCPMTIKREEMFDGKRVVLGRGKGNMEEANKKLKSLPEWKDYIVNHYGIMRTGIGGQSGRGFGFAMLSTYGGKHPGRDDCLVFAIPNNKEERHGEVEIPGNFQKITYGQFYDIVNHPNE